MNKSTKKEATNIPRVQTWGWLTPTVWFPLSKRISVKKTKKLFSKIENSLPVCTQSKSYRIKKRVAKEAPLKTA